MAIAVVDVFVFSYICAASRDLTSYRGEASLVALTERLDAGFSSDLVDHASNLVNSFKAAHMAGRTGILAPNLGSAEYRKRANVRLQLEAQIGLILVKSDYLQSVARRIRTLSGATILGDEERAELPHLVKMGIGGAADLQQGGDSLDGNVLATHLKLDRHENDDRDLKDQVLKHAGINNREPDRRTNRFNKVSSKENPIWPWNCHAFDMDVAEIARWEDFPSEMQTRLQNRWLQIRLNSSFIDKMHRIPSLHDKVGLGGYSHVMDIITLLKDHPVDRKIFLHEILGIAWSTTTSVDDEFHDKVSRSVNPLSPEVRQHKTGMLSNVVRGQDEDDPAVERWITGALRNMKPIISGPSGHTLRFLNHWAWVREEAIKAGRQFMWLYPSLAEARLLMMANMMPPKNHHSYHEIMTASIGITDGLEKLTYVDTGDYTDLRRDALGNALFGEMNFSQEFYHNNPELLPAAKYETPKFNIETSEDLRQKLLQYGSNMETVTLILWRHCMTRGENLCEKILPILDDDVSKKKITEKAAQALRQTILDLFPGLKNASLNS